MRTATTCLAALLALACVATHTQAQSEASCPNRPIAWVVPYGAGWITDSSSRVVAKVLSEKID